MNLVIRQPLHLGEELPHLARERHRKVLGLVELVPIPRDREVSEAVAHGLDRGFVVHRVIVPGRRTVTSRLAPASSERSVDPLK